MGLVPLNSTMNKQYKNYQKINKGKKKLDKTMKARIYLLIRRNNQTDTIYFIEMKVIAQFQSL